MEKVISVCAKLKYLGLLGLPMLFSKAAIWRYLWLFWLLGLVEIVASMPLVIQSIKQLLGLLWIWLSHGMRLPDQFSHKPVVRYSLPFAGRWTVVNGGVNRQNSHSWGIFTQRYAYDFVMLDQQASSCNGDKSSLYSYHCYGQDVLSPADGTVVDFKDGQPDARTFGNGKTDDQVKDIRGNYIVIKHAPKEYSVIAHLLPGSITVTKGQTVVRGQCIARCGNSGNTSEPHVHFQVQDGAGFFTSAGLPITFEGIEASLAPNYSQYDPRGVATEDLLGTPFIQRGYLVENMKRN